MNIRKTLINILEFFGCLMINRYINRYEPIILMYHRIVDDSMLPGLSPEEFERQVSYVSQRFRVISMGDMAREIELGIRRPYTVAITFDDGHSDFYSTAWPILKKYKVPASLYVTTGFVDKTCWLWPDLIRYQLINATSCCIKVEGLGTLKISKKNLLSTWNAIGDYCLKLDPDDRKMVIAEIGLKLGLTSIPSPVEPFAPVTWDQLREMQSEGLEVGSHTVSHSILSMLGKDELIDELGLSYARIKSELQEPPKGICYPNGMSGDVSDYVEDVAKSFYSYGLIAYPYRISRAKIMHLGRWAAPANLAGLKQIMNHFRRYDNSSGESR